VAKALAGIIPGRRGSGLHESDHQGFDEATKLTRAGLTVPWPGFHARNLASSFWQNLTGEGRGLGSPGVMQQLRPALRRFRGWLSRSRCFAGMTDKEATRQLGQMMFAHRGAGSKVIHPLADAVDPLAAASRSLSDVVPGATAQPGLGESLAAYIPKSKAEANPLNIGGFMGRTETKFAPAKSGQMVGNYVDDLARGGMYVDLLKQGIRHRRRQRRLRRHTLTTAGPDGL
jgi:hypothetical protein